MVVKYRDYERHIEDNNMKERATLEEGYQFKYDEFMKNSDH
jgi:hypothetical protein